MNGYSRFADAHLAPSEFNMVAILGYRDKPLMGPAKFSFFKYKTYDGRS